jgi:hypothetical protein
MGADQRFPSGPLQFASGTKGPLGPLWKKGWVASVVSTTALGLGSPLELKLPLGAQFDTVV